MPIEYIHPIQGSLAPDSRTKALPIRRGSSISPTENYSIHNTTDSTIHPRRGQQIKPSLDTIRFKKR